MNSFSRLYKEFESAFMLLPQSFSPKKVNSHLYFTGPHDGEKIDLMFSSLVHGNEFGGLKALTAFIRVLSETSLGFHKRLAFFIGNIEAAKKNRRYLEMDLNRAFGQRVPQTYEAALAQNIEPFLAETKFLVDLHQTQNPSLSDFFIFPQTENNIRFAWYTGKDVPIVVHSANFSVDGMCMDSFLTLNGGTGLTYEMGHIDSSDHQLPRTLSILNRALTLPERNFPLDAPLPSSVFEIQQIVKNSDGATLLPGFVNFASIKKGDSLGSNPHGQIIAKKSGHILFPAYPRKGQNPSELCQIIASSPINEALRKESSYNILRP